MTLYKIYKVCHETNTEADAVPGTVWDSWLAADRVVEILNERNEYSRDYHFMVVEIEVKK